jgi:DNA-binding NtrC family response regulator
VAETPAAPSDPELLVSACGPLVDAAYESIISESTLIDEIADRLLLGERSDWIAAFQLLVSRLEARGGEVGIIGPSSFLGTIGDPEIIMSCGDSLKTSDCQEVIRFFYNFWRKRDTDPICATVLTASEPPIACCAVPYSKNEVLGTIVWGDASSLFADLLPLRIFVRLLAHVLAGKTEIARPTLPGRSEVRKFPDDYIEGCSAVMNSLHREIEMLSPVDFPVLLLGETGVGKEHIAQLLHKWSNRKDGPFMAVNCAAIPTELLEAEMFGIGRGVASGVLERDGYFQLADGGTLFLDEVAELLPSLQAKLLRVLQDKEIRRVGGSKVKPNVRVVAATNADIRKRIEEGSFRPDLFYRIAGFELCIPPLRERRGDLPLFIEHFLRQFSKEAGKTINGITLKTLEALNEYHWPGNVREFMHEMRRLVYVCPDGQPIGYAHLSDRIISGSAELSNELTSRAPQQFSLEAATENLETRMIRKALIKTLGNRTQAAKLLGITRNGLEIKMERLGIKT